MAETVLALFLMGLDLKYHEDEAERDEEFHFQHSSHALNCNFSTIRGPDIRDFVDLAQFVTELRMTW